MAKQRKTFEVEDLRLRVNGMLQLSADSYDRERDAYGSLLSQVLMASGNYAGFAYVDRSGDRVSLESVKSGDYDRTRVVYHRKAN